MRNVNQELNRYAPDWIKERNNIAIAKLMQSKYPYVYCPECGKKILNDNGLISQHMRNFHIKNRSVNFDKGWRYHPTN